MLRHRFEPRVERDEIHQLSHVQFALLRRDRLVRRSIFDLNAVEPGILPRDQIAQPRLSVFNFLTSEDILNRDKSDTAILLDLCVVERIDARQRPMNARRGIELMPWNM